MTARSFVDSNIWVYAVDDADPEKQAAAQAVLAGPGSSGFVVSSQVLGEFYVVTTQRLGRPLEASRAAAMVDAMRRLPTVAVDGDLVGAAVAGAQAWGIAYWDALIIASAAAAGCDVVLSEDLADGRRYGSVLVRNPLKPPSRRLAEDVAAYVPSTSWDDAGLRGALEAYEAACRDAGMRPNAVHAYWDHARRFLDWREGRYPRHAMERRALSAHG
jgi:predicted nucleic acid-binding protein